MVSSAHSRVFTARRFPTILLIVARTETALYEYQARRFAGHQGVEVILDRRYGERRRQSRRVDVSFIALVVDVAWHEPGGLTSGELLDLLVALAPRVGGFALNEVNPLTDAGPKTTILAANLVSQFAVAAVGRNEDDECSFSRGLRYRVRACAKCCEPAAQSHLWCEGWRRL